MMGNSQNKTKAVVLDKNPFTTEEYISDEEASEEQEEEEQEQEEQEEEQKEEDVAPVEEESSEEQGSRENPLIKLPVPDKNTSFHLLIAFINLAFSRGAYTQEEVEKIIECINMFTV